MCLELRLRPGITSGHLQGAAAVASLISRNQSIYSLSLAHCPVRDEGAMALAEALKTNIALYKLDISDCQVSIDR